MTCIRFQKWWKAHSLTFHSVAMYEPMKGEIEVTLLKEQLEKKGAKIHFPRWKDLEPGQMDFGIPPSVLDLIFVPGLAFGMKGERIGRGEGYYDRFLEKAPKAVKIALTYDDLVHPSLPQNDWDQKVNWVMTPTRIIDCSKGKVIT